MPFLATADAEIDISCATSNSQAIIPVEVVIEEHVCSTSGKS
jgi:hypothetical protein